jgi:hypothetical protein
MGGSATIGGSKATGGANATGGAKATGGAQPTGGAKATGGAQPTGGAKATGGAQPTGGAKATGGAQSTGGNKAAGGTSSAAGATATGGNGSVGGTTSVDGLPAGWLYTNGNKIYLSDGNGSGTPWIGRGVNVDDIYFCGYNVGLWMSDAEGTFLTMIEGLMADWKPNFVRVSLGMNTFDPRVSWIDNAAQYKTPMTNIINALGAYPNTYVLVTLRTDASMEEPIDDATDYPTSATDPTYVALVNSFANSKFVMFGIANEPGGNALSNTAISNAMSHAVATIRAEEDRLGVPHHVVAVQGNSWTSDIGFYATKPLSYDNVVYEVHGYPPTSDSYTFSNLPVIIGEYGTLSNSASFFADLEAKQISSLAWDFDPFSNCAPDLVEITRSATDLRPNAWGTTVQNYLLAHAQ